ncbi:E3 ubiquitin-protein ligase RNF220 [Ostrinia nubilalis]|uniref:E3 ubiquitin-protein ligase RNF220 n=1 Tax=Ostrinia nubilalis TaxID=29057 RepID=UPI003082418A
MEGFLHHMAPQFLHPALQSFGCGAFRPIGGAFHPLYPGKAFARHLGEQYALGQSVGQALRSRMKMWWSQSVRDESSTPPLYRHAYAARDDTSSPGSAASASPRPCKDDEPVPPPTCTDSHDFFSADGERKSSCGVCGARLGPGVAQAHFLQELQHLYSLSALPRDAAAPPAHSLHHQDEDARWETFQRIRANRQRRLKLRTRKRHHTVESMLGYDLEEERREERPREPRAYDAEDEPVDVEGDSLGWPDAAISVDDKEQRGDKLHLSYAEDLEISSTNDTIHSPERVRIETPKPLSLECTPKSDVSERPAEVSTSDAWAAAGAPPDGWQLAPESYVRHKLDGENLPSSTDSRN